MWRKVCINEKPISPSELTSEIVDDPRDPVFYEWDDIIYFSKKRALATADSYAFFGMLVLLNSYGFYLAPDESDIEFHSGRLVYHESEPE
jgi:hypothetical protein